MTREERALQIWQVLIGAAHNRQTLTYEMLDRLIEMGGTIVLSNPLDLVAQHCQRNNLPPLTVLVVGKQSGEPGGGYPVEQSVSADRERVYGYPWYALPPRKTADFGA